MHGVLGEGGGILNYGTAIRHRERELNWNVGNALSPSFRCRVFIGEYCDVGGTWVYASGYTLGLQ